MHRGSLLLAGALMALLPITAYAIGETPSSKTTCPTGNVPITAQTRAKATAAGIPASSACWNPNDPSAGADAGSAKEYLQAHACSQTIQTGIAPACPSGTRQLHIEGLQAKFAIYVVEYMKKFEAQYGQNSICVRDAYRAPGEQQCAKNNSANGNAVAQPGRSRHEQGLAVDLNPTGSASYTAMRGFADQNAQCIWFRYQCSKDSSPGNTGKNALQDCPHMELKPTCDGGGGSTTGPGGSAPATPYTNPYQVGGYGMGGQGMTGYPQNIGMPAGTGQNVGGSQGPCPSGSVFYNNTCYPLSSQPMNAAQQPFGGGQSMPAQTGIPSSGGVPMQSSGGYGSSGQQSSAYPSQQTDNTSSSLLSFNQNQNANTASTTLSPAAQRLQDLLSSASSSASAAVIGTSTPLMLNQDTHFVGSLMITTPSGGLSQQPDNSQNPSTQGSFMAVPQTGAQETFTGAGNGIEDAQSTSDASRSRIITVLENLKQALLRAAAFLQSLRSGRSIQNLPQPELIQQMSYQDQWAPTQEGQ